MELAQMALQGARDGNLVGEALDKLNFDSDDEDTTNATVLLCLNDNLFNQNSLCFLLKSRGYSDDVNSPLKCAIAIELKVRLDSVSQIVLCVHKIVDT